MDFKELQYVVTIANEQSITGAANALYISQPTLTKFLQKLEKELGQKLFVRVNNHYQPTYAGQRYIERAQEMLRLKKEMDEEMEDIILSDRSELRIGYPRIRATYMLPLTLPLFARRYPNVRVVVQEKDSPVLERALLTGELDVAFFSGDVQSVGLVQERVCVEEVILLRHKDRNRECRGEAQESIHRRKMELHDFSDERFLISYPGQKTRVYTDQLFAHRSFSPRETFETGSLYTAAALVNQSYGVSIMSANQMLSMPHLQEVELCDIGAPSLDFNAAYRKGGYLSRHARAYIELVREVMAQEGLSMKHSTSDNI